MIQVIFIVIVLMLSLFFLQLFFYAKKTVLIGVVDRIENPDIAVVLIESQDEQIEVPLSEIGEYVEEGMILNLESDGDALQIKGVNYKLTEYEKKRAKELMEQLRKKMK